MAGRFLGIRLPSSTVIPVNKDSDPGENTFYRAFIGELIRLVYAPAYFENGILYDALIDRPLSAWRDEPAAAGADIRPPNWQIKFISTLCLHCGWDLQGEKDALVLTCKNCDSVWNYDGKALKEVPFVVLTADKNNEVVYLPF
jgi:hypothetical protein